MTTESAPLITRLANVIQLATHGRIGNLSVEHHGDCIVLRGCCPSFMCKKLAQDAAMRLVGDIRLCNEVEVWQYLA